MGPRASPYKHWLRQYPTIYRLQDEKSEGFMWKWILETIPLDYKKGIPSPTDYIFFFFFFSISTIVVRSQIPSISWHCKTIVSFSFSSLSSDRQKLSSCCRQCSQPFLLISLPLYAAFSSYTYFIFLLEAWTENCWAGTSTTTIYYVNMMLLLLLKVPSPSNIHLGLKCQSWQSDQVYARRLSNEHIED